MHVVAREAIGGRDEHVVKLAEADSISKPVEPGAIQLRAAQAVVAKDVVIKDRPALGGTVSLKPLKLLVDGLGQGLVRGRYPKIEGGAHGRPPVHLDRRRRRVSARARSIAAGVGRRDPNAASRRAPDEGFGAYSRSAS